jgi:hypothetical protein
VTHHLELLYLIRLTKAEGMGFEPTTPCGASDFESSNWGQLPSRCRSVAGFLRSFLDPSRPRIVGRCAVLVTVQVTPSRLF